MSSTESGEDSLCIETELKDILTLSSCTKLISELIKFILYRKQQLPYTFDRLKYLITERNSKRMQAPAPNTPSTLVERQFKVAEDGLSTLELIFDKTREELAKSAGGCVTEVALLFGSTPFTPKQVYRIHLPRICFDHSSLNHPERKHLFHLLHSVILSKNLTAMLGKPLGLTNMFVFIKKSMKHNGTSRGEESISEWFIPKSRYEIPHAGKHFHIKFRDPDRTSCPCQDFTIYSDDSETYLNTYESSESELLTTDTAWYQACATFKGFSDLYVGGVSVSDLWLR